MGPLDQTQWQDVYIRIGVIVLVDYGRSLSQSGSPDS
jgi:hypothetical protein